MSIPILTIAILIFSAILHECAHGLVAYKLGDHTAKNEGRLTLNPLAHIDLFGTLLLPLILILSKSNFLIGWAKPVPYNPHNLSDQKYGDLKVAAGGPISNLAIAIIAGGAGQLLPLGKITKNTITNAYFSGDYEIITSLMNGSLHASIFTMLIIFCFINLLLMAFNLVPLPPLDGSKILKTYLPPNGQIIMDRVEPYGFFIIFGFLYLGLFNFIWPIILFLFISFTGL